MRAARALGLLLLAPLAACAWAPREEATARPAPVFSPQAFFGGRTVGEGTLRIVLSGARHTHVVGRGHVLPDGTLVLVQTIDEEGEAPRKRTWRVRPTGDDGRFTGTLTDARGPVTGRVDGNLLTIRYVMKDGGYTVEQSLFLQPDGRSAFNRTTVEALGIPIARLTETISRKGR